MKIKIKKVVYEEGGSKPRPPKKNIMDWFNRLKTFGYEGPAKPGDMQSWMVKNHPGAVVEFMKENPPTRLTNKGRRLYGNKRFEDLTDEELKDSFHDNLWDYRDPTPMSEKYKPKFRTEDDEENVDSSGNEYDLNDEGKQKQKYKQKGLPFYQALPELAGYTEALNTYNYYTPDYTHQEITPPKLNIQPQIQSIDSSLDAINSSTTGNPQVDNIRKSAAFTQALNAKQQAFSNKQNYDAQGRFQADQFNISARTQEQNMDVYGVNQVYNNLIPLAKDYAAGERIAAISSLTNKVAENKKNENFKSLYLDNFYQNYQVDENGNFVFQDTGDPYSYDYYSEQDSINQTNNKITTTTPSTTVKLPESDIKTKVPEITPTGGTEELQAIYGNDIYGNNPWGNPTPSPIRPTRRQPSVISPLFLPQEDLEDQLFMDPIRNQMKPISYKKGGKKKKKSNYYY